MSCHVIWPCFCLVSPLLICTCGLCRLLPLVLSDIFMVYSSQQVMFLLSWSQNLASSLLTDWTVSQEISVKIIMLIFDHHFVDHSESEATLFESELWTATSNRYLQCSFDACQLLNRLSSPIHWSLTSSNPAPWSHTPCILLPPWEQHPHITENWGDPRLGETGPIKPATPTPPGFRPILSVWCWIITPY
jgi:hypothetical protein